MAESMSVEKKQVFPRAFFTMLITRARKSEDRPFASRDPLRIDIDDGHEYRALRRNDRHGRPANVSARCSRCVF